MSGVQQARMERLIRASSLIVIGALVVEGASLFWRHPLGFMLFTFVVPALLAAGVGMFLLGLLRRGSG